MPDFRRKATREAMRIRIDFNGMMSDAIGETGIARDEVEALAPRIKEVSRNLEAQRTAGEIAFYDLPTQKDAVAEIKELAAKRDAFIAGKVKDMGGAKDSLDQKVYQAVRAQGAAVGLSYESAAPRY